MKNLSEYLPLIIIIVSAVISMVGKGKKKQAQQEFLPEAEPDEAWTQETASEVDDWWNEKPQPAPVVEPTVETVKPLPVVHRPSRKKAQIRTEPVVQSPVFQEDEFSGIGIDLSGSDELKKAIVYSEIFARKY